MNVVQLKKRIEDINNAFKSDADIIMTQLVDIIVISYYLT